MGCSIRKVENHSLPQKKILVGPPSSTERKNPYIKKPHDQNIGVFVAKRVNPFLCKEFQKESIVHAEAPLPE